MGSGGGGEGGDGGENSSEEEEFDPEVVAGSLNDHGKTPLPCGQLSFFDQWWDTQWILSLKVCNTNASTDRKPSLALP